MLADFFIRFGKVLLENPQAIMALVEALEGGMTEAELVASIRASMVAGTEAAVEADLGPRP